MAHGHNSWMKIATASDDPSSLADQVLSFLDGFLRDAFLDRPSSNLHLLDRLLDDIYWRLLRQRNGILD